MADGTGETRMTRERFVRSGVGATVSLAVLGSPLLRPALAGPAPEVRRDLGGLAVNHPIIKGYAKAYQAMLALPTSDPRSWAYQAAIHGTTLPGSNIAWNTCPHGSPYFWSWHRMYLYYFERIVRKYAGNPNWALPYWNYQSASQRQLPPAFRTGGPLEIANRGAGWNSGASSLPAWAVDTSSGMSQLNYMTAQSQLEGTPHGVVHGLISGWMGAVNSAAQDPVFWVHHCNIDRLWNLWLAQGGGRSNPLSDAAWRTTKFTFFDENATQVTLTGCQVLRAAQQLGYTYEGEPAQVNQYCFRILFPWKFAKELLFRLPLPELVIPRLPEPKPYPFDIRAVRSRILRAADTQTETVILRLDGIQAQLPPGLVWQVFLAPRGAALDPAGPHFVGTLPLFSVGLPKQRGGSTRSIEFPLSRALARRAAREDVQLTFVPAGPLVRGRGSRPTPKTAVRIARVSLSIETRSRR